MNQPRSEIQNISDTDAPSPLSFVDDLAFRRTHWALERTQLSWIRTAFALTGAGFALDKGTVALDRADLLETNNWVTGGLIGGVTLSLLAAVQLTIATFAYVRREKQLRAYAKQPRIAFPLAFPLSIAGIVFSLVVGLLMAVL